MRELFWSSQLVFQGFDEASGFGVNNLASGQIRMHKRIAAEGFSHRGVICFELFQIEIGNVCAVPEYVCGQEVDISAG